MSKRRGDAPVAQRGWWRHECRHSRLASCQITAIPKSSTVMKWMWAMALTILTATAQEEAAFKGPSMWEYTAPLISPCRARDHWQESTAAIPSPIVPRRQVHRACKLANHVAVIAESGLQRDGDDGFIGLDEELADFADAELPDVG